MAKEELLAIKKAGSGPQDPTPKRAAVFADDLRELPRKPAIALIPIGLGPVKSGGLRAFVSPLSLRPTLGGSFSRAGTGRCGRRNTQVVFP